MHAVSYVRSKRALGTWNMELESYSKSPGVLIRFVKYQTGHITNRVCIHGITQVGGEEREIVAANRRDEETHNNKKLYIHCNFKSTLNNKIQKISPKLFD